MKLGYVLICLTLSFLVGCAAPPLPKESLDALLSSPELASEFKKAMEASAKQSVKHKGKVRVKIGVWTVWAGDGPLPNTDNIEEAKTLVGEMYPQWLFKGENSLSEVKLEPVVKNTASIFNDNDKPLSNPITSTSFTLTPSEEDLKVVVRVYDKDEIGDQTYKEAENFIKNVGAQGANLYPEKEILIPVIQELGELIFLDLPNLFLANDPLGTIRFTIPRDMDGIQTGEFWYEENHLICRVTVEKI